MASEIETSVAQVGLRDFLFYVVPGAVLLAGALALRGLEARDLQPYLNVSSSLAAILASYILGQCAYPTSYLIRSALNRFGDLRTLKGEKEADMRAAYRRVAKRNPTYFAVEVFRYRTMARFCSVMVLPVLFAAACVAWGNWQLGVRERAVVLVLAGLTAAGFLYRYFQYERRYRSSLAASAARAASTGAGMAEEVEGVQPAGGAPPSPPASK